MKTENNMVLKLIDSCDNVKANFFFSNPWGLRHKEQIFNDSAIQVSDNLEFLSYNWPEWQEFPWSCSWAKKDAESLKLWFSVFPTF